MLPPVMIRTKFQFSRALNTLAIWSFKVSRILAISHEVLMDTQNYRHIFYLDVGIMLSLTVQYRLVCHTIDNFI